MSIQAYFINDTEKQIVDSKVLFGDFEDGQQLLSYLSFCGTCNMRIEFEDSKFIEDWKFNNKHKEYKHIKLHQFDIKSGDDMYKNDHVEKLLNEIRSD